MIGWFVNLSLKENIKSVFHIRFDVYVFYQCVVFLADSTSECILKFLFSSLSGCSVYFCVNLFCLVTIIRPIQVNASLTLIKIASQIVPCPKSYCGWKSSSLRRRCNRVGRCSWTAFVRSDLLSLRRIINLHQGQQHWLKWNTEPSY